MTVSRRLLTCAAVGGLLLAGVTPAAAATPAPAAPTSVLAGGAKINQGKAPCKSLPSLKGKKPGQLLKYKELKVDPALLQGARMFRVLYTTAGVDEKHVQASCGLVLIPTKPKDRTNEVVAYAHGTIGMHQSCQPSNNPTNFLTGLGAISYGQGKYAVRGKQKFGILQGLIDGGRTVAATDYYSGLGEPASAQQNYVLGVPAAAATLDSVRAAVQVENALEKKGKDPKSWKVATWGISQGGHAAFWAAQLAKDYFAGTALKKDPKYKPVGTAAVVPASSFIATASTPPELIGRHLGDLEMHEPATVVNGRPVGNMGALLFSLVVTSWEKYPGSGTLQSDAAFPGYPGAIPTPQLDEVLTGPANGNGQEVAQSIAAGCLSANLAFLTDPYNDPAQNAFFQQPMWGGPGPDGTWVGHIDATCLNPAADPEFDSWCTWLAYNQPGPDGVNPFNKIPRRANGSYADILIAEGMDDNVVWCMQAGKDLPTPANCLARQLYDSLTPACSSASVKLDVFAKTKKSPASHISTYAQLADNGKAKYKGSRLDKWFNGAFKNSLKSGCKASVVNG